MSLQRVAMKLPLINPVYRPACMGRRRAGLCAALLAGVLVGLATVGSVHAQGLLVTRSEAARVGLNRAWFAQVPVDQARSRVTNWYLYYGNLYCVTDSGLVTALDAETGARLWTKRFGQPGVPALGPAANDEYLGVVSGSKLYIMNRANGRLLWTRDLGSAPSSGPALTRKYAFVAMVTGRIEAYKLDEPEKQPWYYQSKGRTHLQPTTTGNFVSWPTSLGILYVCRADDPAVRFRLESNDDIVTSPAEKAPYLYIASLDGNLYCMEEEGGLQKWRYTTGYAIVSSPAIVGDRAYVASLEPVLHAVDAATGTALWKAPGVSHFGAQGKERVYASDQFGNLLILDLKTGQPIGGLRTAEGLHTLVNDQSDRLFLVNDRGLVQCFHELDAEQPTVYRVPPTAEATEPADGKKPAPAEAPAEATEAAPEATEAPEAGAEEPAAPEEPAAAPDDNDNPFDN